MPAPSKADQEHARHAKPRTPAWPSPAHPRPGGGGDSFALWAGKANAFTGSVRLGGEPPSRGRTAPLGLGGGS